LKGCERDPTANIETDPFALEKASLYRVVPGRRADSALGIHDALPWNSRPGGQRMHCVADETRVSGQAGDACDLSIGRHAAARNA
jgi:hypothetical protein